MKKQIEIIYRCAANYKSFHHILVDEDFNLEEGDTFNMGEYGTPCKEAYFETYQSGDYSDELDHGLFEVSDLQPTLEGEVINLPKQAHYKTFANKAHMMSWWRDYKNEIHGCHEVGAAGIYKLKFYLN